MPGAEKRCHYEMSCLLMSYNMNCTDCNVTRLSSSAMGKMLGPSGIGPKDRMGQIVLSHTGVETNKDCKYSKERTADGKSKKEYFIRKTYPLRKRLHTQESDLSSPVTKELEGASIRGVPDGASSMQIVEQWDCVNNKSRLRGETPEVERNKETGKENEKLRSTKLTVLDLYSGEPRPRRLASLNAEAVNNLLLEREDCALSSRRCRRDPGRVVAKCSSEHTQTRAKGSTCSSEVHVGLRKSTVKGGLPAKRCTNHSESSSEGDVFVESYPALESRSAQLPVKKRMASLNAAAFLKLTHTKDYSTKRRSRSDSDGKLTKASNGVSLHCVHPVSKRCTKTKKRDLGRTATERHQRRSCSTSEDSKVPVRKGEPLVLGQSAARLPSRTDSSSPYTDKAGGYLHRLSVIMGGQATVQPPYQTTKETSPTPSAEFMQQMTTPFPPHPTMTVLGNLVPGLDHYPFLSPEMCLTSAEDNIYRHYDKNDLSPNGCNPSQNCWVYPPSFPCCPQLNDEGSLLISQSAVPSGIPFPHAPCGDSPCYLGDTATVQCMGMPGYMCRMLNPPLNRDTALRTSPSGRSSRHQKIAIKSDRYKSLEPLNVTIPVAGHPVSPANPLSGCPVPTAPPTAEPVPYLQGPGSDPPATSQPHMLSMLKLARECPQRSKPPSGSKSNLRNSTCAHTQRSKSATEHSERKHQRISRRRATNGWRPVGEPYEKPVYVVGEVELVIRKCYPAVARDGEVIKVRDTVLLKSGPRKKSIPYVAKISALWEDPTTGELTMSLYWYYRPEHIQGGRNPSLHCENEIFASRHQDENSVACIEEKCYVLTFSEYCRFCALIKRREEGTSDHRLIVPTSEAYSTPSHRKVPENTDPDLVFICRHVYDFRYGRILKNPQ
eukprot:gi/632944868/ref/XP_007887735.1/ PREDICTED: bromo adjacent homology domain-containing 1 protein isoform X1 [Callorhinchus milii]